MKSSFLVGNIILECARAFNIFFSDLGEKKKGLYVLKNVECTHCCRLWEKC